MGGKTASAHRTARPRRQRFALAPVEPATEKHPRAPHKTQGNRDDWTTPAYVVAAVREALGGTIDLDPCGNARSIVGAKRELRLERGENGLTDSWAGAKTVYVNSPFGVGLSRWVGRCVAARRDLRAEVVQLLPVATETAWWQRMIFPTAAAICFPDHRIAFDEGEGGGAPMATSLVYWGSHPDRFASACLVLGHVVSVNPSLRWFLHGPDATLLLKGGR